MSSSSGSGSSGLFSGLTFCLSGRFGCTKAELEQTLVKHGGRVMSVPNKECHILIADELGSSKTEKAQKDGITILRSVWVDMSISRRKLCTEPSYFLFDGSRCPAEMELHPEEHFYIKYRFVGQGKYDPTGAYVTKRMRIGALLGEWSTLKNYHVLLNGQPLDDNKTIGDYGIQSGCTLDVRLRPLARAADGVFAGHVFCVLSGPYENSSFNELKGLLDRNGGAVVASPDAQTDSGEACDFVVAPSLDASDAKAAVQKGIAVVTEDWVQFSLHSKQMLTDADFFLFQPAVAAPEREAQTDTAAASESAAVAATAAASPAAAASSASAAVAPAAATEVTSSPSRNSTKRKADSGNHEAQAECDGASAEGVEPGATQAAAADSADVSHRQKSSRTS